MFKLLKNHFQILAPLFLVMFFGGLGQTFLVAQYNPYIQETLNLTRTQVSFVYSLATFLASLNLTLIGTLFDKVKTSQFAFVTMILIAMGLGTISLSTGIVSLFFGFYLLRGFGQVTISLIGSTSVSKLFGSNRGKALTLIGFGRSVSEGILPPLVIFLIGLYGWRSSLHVLIAIFIALMLPIIFYFIPKLPSSALYEEKEHTKVNVEKNQMIDWSWKTVFKRKWPLLIMITNSIYAFSYTGLFIEQASVAGFKNWTMAQMAAAFTMFSIFQISGNFIWGPMVDKFGALKLQRFSLIPIFLSLTTLLNFTTPVGAFIYLAFAGIGIGFSGMVANTFWAEIYGVINLGRIKGMNSKITVIATSIAPILFASILDMGYSMGLIVKCLMIIATLGMVSHIFIYRKFR